MRYLLNTLFGLTIVLIGFAHAQTARASVIDPMITDFSMDPIMWFVDENIEGDITITAVSSTDPAFGDVELDMNITDSSNMLAGPIGIEAPGGLMTFVGNDELAGYTVWIYSTLFTYTPDGAIGDFFLNVNVFTVDKDGDTTGDTFSQQLTFTIKPIPEPSTLALFGIGLAGLGFMGWRRRTGVDETKHAT